MTHERKKITVKLAVATWTWVGSTALTSFGPRFIWSEDNYILSALSLLLNVVLGLWMVLSLRRLFLNFDELELKIHLDSLAITLGLSVVFGMGFNISEQIGLLPFKADISALIMFMSLCYWFSLMINRRRYL